METVNLLALDSCLYHPYRLGVQCTPGTTLSKYRPSTSAKLIDVMKVYVTCIAYLSSATNATRLFPHEFGVTSNDTVELGLMFVYDLL